MFANISCGSEFNSNVLLGGYNRCLNTNIASVWTYLYSFLKTIVLKISERKKDHFHPNPDPPPSGFHTMVQDRTKRTSYSCSAYNYNPLEAFKSLIQHIDWNNPEFVLGYPCEFLGYIKCCPEFILKYLSRGYTYVLNTNITFI